MREQVIDAVTSRSAESAAHSAFNVLDMMQRIPHPADQILGLALAFRNVIDVCGLSVGELFHQIERMEADCRFRHANTLDAVRAYVRGEIKSKYP